MAILRRYFRHRSSARRLAVLLAWLVGLSLSVGIASVAAVAWRLPDPDELFSRRIVQSTKIYDRTGQILLFDIHGEERRTVIPGEEIPVQVKNATVAIEDASFWRHRGIDLKGIGRALLVDLVTRDLRQGGSTITQQLVKNALVGRSRTIRRKVREAVAAVVLESRLPKEKILELYLNQIPYGSNAYGIEAAAETYFGKRAQDLSLAESALLAALPRAPSYYSPYGQHRDGLIARQRLILRRMAELGYVTESEARVAEAEPLTFLPVAKNIRAPHFVMYVREYLIERYGEEEVETGGLKVTTTLDWQLQEKAEELVRAGAERNEKLIKASNMALVAIAPPTGEILAMVGSRDYFDIAREGNFNVATAPRQPGSAFKPFVYATAFQKGYQPEMVLFDVPTEFNPRCGPEGTPQSGTNEDPKKCYHPQNYDETFRGPVTVRSSLAQSLNVPSVKLLYLAGIEDSIKTAEAVGITTLGDRSRFGLSLVLGGAEVKLLEMVSAFSAFANDGLLNPLTAILRVEAPDGRVIEEKKNAPTLVIDPEISRLVNDILSDNDARVPVFQPRSSLYFPDRRVAVKTGTTQDFRDAWTVGYTPALAAGVWAGNNDNSPMQQKGSGVLAAAPTWHAFMEFALANTPPGDFPLPARASVEKPILKGLWQGEVVTAIDRISGKRATAYTPPETTVEVAYGTPHEPLYWIDRQNPTGPPPANPESDPQYPNWAYAFSQWLAGSGMELRGLGELPSEFDPIHVPEKRPRVSGFKKAESRDAYVLELEVSSTYPLREVSLLEGERILRSEKTVSSPLTLTLRRDELSPETAAVLVKAYDSVGNVGEASITLR